MGQAGRVVQVSVSAGGVPKQAVDEAWVGWLGLDGDGHRERTVHGGPQRAVCLFSLEAIERLQAEGHPVEPGSVGENLTTLGIEWSTLPIGTRARIGARLLLELASSTTPCDTQRPNFLGGRISRINIELHPSDSRMYARVLEEGQVRPGDPVELLPPAADSRAETDALLARIEPLEKRASLRLWAAARAAGLQVHVLADGDICAGASRSLTSRAFNHAHGLRMMPHLLPEILAHFDRFTSSAVVPHVAPRPGAEPVAWITVHAAPAGEIQPGDPPAGIAVEQVPARDERVVAAWMEAYCAEMEPADSGAWRALLPHLFATSGLVAFLARVDGRPAGVGLLHVRRHVALLRGGYVLPAWRGRGIQRALIAARGRAALELGCDLVASMAEQDSPSGRNLARMGLRQVDAHPVYEYVPSRVGAAA